MIKYTQNGRGEILKDGHTMFKFDILTDLNRKAFLEEKLENKISLPKELTAENGAKYLLSGEFSESEEIMCPECLGNWDETGCGCNEGVVLIDVPVSWSVIKDIYRCIVKHYS